MGAEELEQYINDLKIHLPFPSQVKEETTTVVARNSHPSIVFEKEYHDNICIGWKFKKIREDGRN